MARVTSNVVNAKTTGTGKAQEKITAGNVVPAGHTRAIALVGFYRGAQLVFPGDYLDLPDLEFAELRGFYKVDQAPMPIQAPDLDL